MQPVAIVGIGAVKIGKHDDKATLDLAQEVFFKSLSDAGIKSKDIEGLYITPEGFGVPNAQLLGARMAEFFNLQLKTLNKCECGGSSSLIALNNAISDIESGRVEIACVLAVDKRMQMRGEDIEFYLRSGIVSQFGLYGVYDAPYGIGTPVPYYAFSTQRYIYEYGVDPEKIAYLPVILRENAKKNPLAQYQSDLTLQDVLNSRLVSPPIHLYECTTFSDGAVSLILSSKNKAKKFSRPIFITGRGEFHDSSHFVPYNANSSITTFISVVEAAKQSLKSANKKIEDIDIAEVYGVFAGTELMIYEDLGFFEKGKAPDAVFEGKTKITGEIPINTSGGRISGGHPATATPLYEIVEVVQQLRGEAEDRQVKGAKCGLVHAEHGMVNGSVVFILEKL